MSTPALTTTSYAILSLLGLRPWSTYELAQQMDRSLGRIWPRAQSKLYEEPKKLVAHGLATSREEYVGARRRTVYTITARGRRALARWHRDPGDGPVVESEQLLKVFFAEHGSRADLLRTLAATREWAEERNRDSLEAAQAYLAGRGPFQERGAQTMLVGRFITELYRMVAEWADWATGVVDDWPDRPGDAQADPAALRETVQRGQWGAAEAE